MKRPHGHARTIVSDWLVVTRHASFFRMRQQRLFKVHVEAAKRLKTFTFLLRQNLRKTVIDNKQLSFKVKKITEQIYRARGQKKTH